ncbi:CDP-glycerol glycerophosphotransferase family protein [Methanobrevibacter sp.]|uniref:CDP-glycerol glycerophosphotransferase family protein n=1 Tax=Methanobrevibacter sp. TaxID=66852 RepID=UPI0038704607
MGFKDKFRNLNECRINSAIYDAYYNKDINEKIVYVESRNGFDFAGNMFRIVEELSTGDYGDFRIYVFAHSHVKPKIEDFMKSHNLKIYEIITSPDRASEILHTAKYIFTDSGIRYKYVKKPGQIFVNTWHGTIMKLMGIDNNHERLTMGIIQRSLLFSDYLIFPSDYLKERLLNSFMLDGIYPGKMLLEGYPRNSVFLDDGRRDELKNEFGLQDFEIFIYMPTFKGLVDDRKNEKQKDDVDKFLGEIDENLKDSQILFAKLHPYNTQKIDFSRFDHIKPFPNGFEIYDIVNMADCLITDYSSVFFDFANTRRKIIIFNYDEEEYLKDRGLYFPLSDLPFPKVQSVSDLMSEMNSPKDYDDTEFIEKFCQYERMEAAKYICEAIFKNDNSSQLEMIENGKPNVLLYAGDFSDKGTVDSLNGFVERIDTTRYNLFVSFCPWMKNIKENPQDIFKDIPQNIGFLPFSYNLMPTVREKLKYNQLSGNSQYDDSLKRFFKRTFEQQYGNLKFEHIIDFDADDLERALIFDNACDSFHLFSKSESKVEGIIDEDCIIRDLDALSKLL